MIIINPRLASRTAMNIEVEIIVTTTAGSEIFDISVISGRDGSVISNRPAGCTRAFAAVLSVPLIQLPILVLASECERNPQGEPTRGAVTSVGPLFNEERPNGRAICPPPGITSDTSRPPISRACEEAQARLRTQRSEILALCNDASAIRSRRDAYAAVAAAMFVLAAALAATAAGIAAIPIIGHAIAIVIFVLAGIALAVAIGFSIAALVEQVALDRKLAEISVAQRRYGEDAANLSRVCCPEHITVELDPPSC